MRSDAPTVDAEAIERISADDLIAAHARARQ
jgi:hypothetical protein